MLIPLHALRKADDDDDASPCLGPSFRRLPVPGLLQTEGGTC